MACPALPLLLFAIAIICLTIGFLAVAYVVRRRHRLRRSRFPGSCRARRPRFSPASTRSGASPYTRKARCGEALAEFEIAVDQRPDNINYLYEYGRILIELDNFDQAAEIGDRAIAAAPERPARLRPESARPDVERPRRRHSLAVRGLEHDAEFAPLHAALAIAYTNIGRYSEGYQRGLLATQLDPLDAFSHRAFAIPLIYTDRRNRSDRRAGKSRRHQPEPDGALLRTRAAIPAARLSRDGRRHLSAHPRVGAE